MKGLFLDDERNVEDVTWKSYPDEVEWDIARSAAEFFNKLEERDYGIFSFDHDIQSYDGMEEITGYTCLRGMLYAYFDKGKTFPECLFHSKNPVGIENMKSFYYNFKEFVKSNND